MMNQLPCGWDQKVCPYCGGSGGDEEDLEDCPVCGGSGCVDAAYGTDEWDDYEDEEE